MGAAMDELDHNCGRSNVVCEMFRTVTRKYDMRLLVDVANSNALLSHHLILRTDDIHMAT